MIRQAISCDICGNEKKQTNHWFVAYEQSGELRLSGWNSRGRLRAGAKHLCGQTCLHKLVDEYIARAMEMRPQARGATVAETAEASIKTDTSLTSTAARAEAPPSPRQPALPSFTVAARPQPEVLAMPGRPDAEAYMPPPEPRFASRNWRAEAWERERDRELRAVERHPDIARRRSSA